MSQISTNTKSFNAIASLPGVRSSEARCHMEPPIQRLPSEILEQIFSLVTYRTQILRTKRPANARLQLVCSRWNEILLSSGRFWNDIDCIAVSSVRSINTLLGRSHTLPLHIEFHALDKNTGSFLLTHHRHLQTLVFTGSSSLDYWQGLGSFALCLEMPWSQLQRLEIQGMCVYPDAFSVSPKLRALLIHNDIEHHMSISWSKLRELLISGEIYPDDVLRKLRDCYFLELLTVKGCCFFSDIPTDNLDLAWAYVPQLSVLEVLLNYDWDIEWSVALLCHLDAPRLSRMSIKLNMDHYSGEIEWSHSLSNAIIHSSSSLRHLSIGTIQITANELTRLLSALPLLSSFAYKEINQPCICAPSRRAITDDFLLRLRDLLPYLEHLSLILEGDPSESAFTDDALTDTVIYRKASPMHSFKVHIYSRRFSDKCFDRLLAFRRDKNFKLWLEVEDCDGCLFSRRCFSKQDSSK